MKKLFIFFISLVCLISFTGCSKPNQPDNNLMSAKMINYGTIDVLGELETD